jgi:hypothetical protein
MGFGLNHISLLLTAFRMKQAIMLILGLLATLTPAVSQDFDHYKPIRSSGVIPRDFTTLSSTKFQVRAENDTSAQSDLEKKIRDQFYLESSFSVDQLLHSGKVMFNDPISDYVNQVVDIILKDEPELRSKVRFYVIKSPYVNAFATNEGIIFLNIALLAKADNEAELAFVLSHEIMHYVQKHVITGYVETELIDKQNALGRLSQESRFLSKEKYSQEFELEADSLGLELFLKSPYNFLAADEAMDMLLYSDLPFGEREVELGYFEIDALEIPEKYYLEDIYEISHRDEDYADEHSSHPNVARRRAVLESIIGDSISADGSFFEVSAEEFQRLQKVAQFEMCNLWMKEGNYRRALYSAYTLQEDDPESHYLHKIVTKSLYGLTKYANRDRSHSYLAALLARKTEGEISRMNYFLRRMKPSEKNIFALMYAWEQHRENPDDDEYTNIVDDLVHEMYYYHEDLTTRIVDSRGEDYQDSNGKGDLGNDEEDIEDDEETDGEHDELDGKYESKNNFRVALFKSLGDEDFLNQFTSVASEVEEYWQLQLSEMLGLSIGDDEAMNVEKVMIVDPFYWSIDQRKEKDQEYLVAEDKKKNFERLILENAALANLDVEILSTNNLNREDAERFNDMALLKEFFSEYYMHNGMEMNTYGMNELNALKQKYGTRYFCWLGAMNIRHRKHTRDYVRFGISALFYPMLPVGLVNLIKAKYETFIFAFVYDIEENQTKLMQFQNFPKQDRESLFNSQLYNLFLQMGSSNTNK